jgi:uncharacterized membrane protein
VSRLHALWLNVRDSLWFLPTLITAGAVALALITIELDRSLVDREYIAGYWFIFAAGAEGARGVLSAIAQSIMTVTGVVFSVTIIALQLASTQYTPRVLRRFTDDRANQLVLGIFIGTFVYALLVLRVVRGEDEFVPAMAVTAAVLLALLSVGALIYFIDHIASSLKAEAIITRVALETHRVIDRVYPRDPDGVAEQVPFAPDAALRPEGEGGPLPAAASGYLQGIDPDALRDAVDGELTLEMEREVGDFVLSGESLATVWPAAAAKDEERARRLRAGFLIGEERTPYQDVERGLVELVDIAVKALSPSVYEPTTAITCLHRLSELLAHLARRAPPSRHRSADRGRLRFIAPHSGFESAVRLVFRPIRRYGEGQAAILMKLLEMAGRLGALVPGHCRQALQVEVDETLVRAEAVIASTIDLDEIRAAARDATSRINA